MDTMCQFSKPRQEVSVPSQVLQELKENSRSRINVDDELHYLPKVIFRRGKAAHSSEELLWPCSWVMDVVAASYLLDLAGRLNTHQRLLAKDLLRNDLLLLKRRFTSRNGYWIAGNLRYKKNAWTHERTLKEKLSSAASMTSGSA
ncbi:hypothetical protein NPIL_197261 [Nephila pilipes]|uniref:Uncharacterized protein n=1 Tax=Nephila pilipes TaxID=299642 RepID=A0A8X6U2S7_NEPPI|nr:hypothetical protein NPIL_197261 [Nephila pilipes]